MTTLYPETIDICIPPTPAELLSHWENPYLADYILFRHDLLQRILDGGTLHVAFQVWFAIGQLKSFLLSSRLTRKYQSSRAHPLRPFVQVGTACRE